MLKKIGVLPFIFLFILSGCISLFSNKWIKTVGIIHNVTKENLLIHSAIIQK